MLTFSSADEALQQLLGDALTTGVSAHPRGLPTSELIGVSFKLTSPRRRCITLPSRRWRLPLALGEFCWHVAGRDDVNSLAYYAKRWREFSDDGMHITGSCYGRRIFNGSGESLSQWEMAKELARADPDSRRIVLDFRDSNNSLSFGSKDVACACTMQFLIRNGYVDAIVYMRSNDIMLGLPYDVFVFTMFQELFAAELKMEVGEYHHMVGSLHLYERDYPMAKKVLTDRSSSSFAMPRMEAHNELPYFVALEEQIRTNTTQSDIPILSKYWSDLAQILIDFKSAHSSTMAQFRESTETPYSFMMK